MNTRREMDYIRMEYGYAKNVNENKTVEYSDPQTVLILTV